MIRSSKQNTALAKAEAKRWRPDRLAEDYGRFFQVAATHIVAAAVSEIGRPGTEFAR